MTRPSASPPQPSQAEVPGGAVAQILGQRRQQEDSLRLTGFTSGGSRGLLALVCDGMGGHPGGDRASGLVADQFIEHFLNASGTMPERLRRALTGAHEALQQAASANPALEDMGTTLVAACVVGAELYWLSVGDSLLWLLRQGQLQRLNEDHSMAPVFERLVAMGEMSATAAEQDGQRHALRSVVTRQPIHRVDGPEQPLRLQPGDAVLVASDGLGDLAAEDIIAALAPSAGNTEQRLQSLFERLQQRQDPQQDNASAVLLEIPPHTDSALATGGGITPRSPSRWLHPIGCILVALILFLIVTEVVGDLQ
ncbi:PP2C family protein-serine/threonine phosphatase [Marinobacter sp. SS21]|uniref:PP2C family protein-serine/threonine phosphatase n=1 Tax=Marinobacter sp. SS21 TaxID=2979460 RepID=UPI00232A99A0|nr:protein phosphatase 2C domain-containing protein [Marinobacter sp. SS21]MDC0663159.1 protein phosphatase 2C domain-containing protein [Marinobacter sp. SS21]